jgi:hypothetical protein
MVFTLHVFQEVSWNLQQCKIWHKKEWLIGRCQKNGDLHKEDLAKSGYKVEFKYKSLIICLYV